MMANFKVREPEEDTIELIMKRLGVQKSVIVLRDLVSSMFIIGVWGLIASFAFWGGLFMNKLSIGVIIVFSLLFMVQVSLRSIIINRMAPGRLSFLIMVSIFFLQLMLSNVLVGSSVPNPGLATTACIISPMLQLNLMFKMGIVQYTQGNNLNFANLGLEVFP